MEYLGGERYVAPGHIQLKTVWGMHGDILQNAIGNAASKLP